MRLSLIAIIASVLTLSPSISTANEPITWIEFDPGKYQARWIGSSGWTILSAAERESAGCVAVLQEEPNSFDTLGMTLIGVPQVYPTKNPILIVRRDGAESTNFYSTILTRGRGGETVYREKGARFTSEWPWLSQDGTLSFLKTLEGKAIEISASTWEYPSIPAGLIKSQSDLVVSGTGNVLEDLQECELRTHNEFGFVGKR